MSLNLQKKIGGNLDIQEIHKQTAIIAVV